MSDEERLAFLKYADPKYVSKAYFNTTNELEPLLTEYKFKAGIQNDVIAEWFRQRPNEAITPSMVWQSLYNGTLVPLTSVRRSINVLTGLGVLEKTTEKKEGLYGRSELCWVLKH
jgi:hypothetical protein